MRCDERVLELDSISFVHFTHLNHTPPGRGHCKRRGSPVEITTIYEFFVCAVSSGGHTNTQIVAPWMSLSQQC